MEDKTNETPITSTVYGEAVKGAQTPISRYEDEDEDEDDVEPIV